MTKLKLEEETAACWWCGGRFTGEPRRIQFVLDGKPHEAAVCSPEHEQAVVGAYRYVQRFLPLFWTGMAVTVTLFILSNFVRATTWCVLAAFLSLGLTMVLCPFTTPQTVELFGLRRSFLIGRIAGAGFLVVVLGVAIARILR